MDNFYLNLEQYTSKVELKTSTLENALTIVDYVDNGLVFYVDSVRNSSYKGYGRGWNDISGNRSIVYLNDPTWNDTNKDFTFLSNDSGWFSGSTVLNLNQQTISVWAYSTEWRQTTGAGGGVLVLKTTNGTVNTSYQFFFNYTSSLYADLFYRTPGVSTQDLLHRLDYTTYNNTWVNFVGTWDGTYKKIYVNGVLKETSAALTGSITCNDTGSAMIGAYPVGDVASGYYFDGKMGNIMIYNRGLTQDEVTQNYNSFKNRYV